MGGSFIYPRSPVQLPSFSALNRPGIGNPVFSLKVVLVLGDIDKAVECLPNVRSLHRRLFNLAEIACKHLGSSIRVDGSRERPKKNTTLGKAHKTEGPEDNPQSFDGGSSLSSNKEEILALFKRIQSSISKGETVNSKKRNARAAEERPSPFPSAESILEVLHQSITRPKVENISKKKDKFRAPQKDTLKKEERVAHLSTTGLKSTRPPSSRFTRRSPIPSLSTPRDGKIKLENGGLSATEDNDYQQSLKLEEMKLPQLKEVAKSRGIKGYSKLKKSELVELLSRSLNNVSS